MGARGPKPTPTPLKVVRGDRPSRVNLRAPVPERGTTAPRLTDAAQAEWERLAPELRRSQRLGSTDREAFAVYCEAVSAMTGARDILADEGLTSIGAKGQPVAHPAWQVFRDAATLVLRAGAEFGLSPSSATRLKTETISEDEAARLLS